MQTNAVTMVATKPVVSPAHLNAYGIDRIPDPNAAFNKCVNVSASLQKTEAQARINKMQGSQRFHYTSKV